MQRRLLNRGLPERGMIAGALIFAMCGWFGVAQADEPVRIAVPLELSGDMVSRGVALKRGAELAVAAFKGQVGSKNIELVERDIQTNAQSAVTGVDDMLGQQKIHYMIGPVSSLMAVAVIPAWRQYKPVWMEPGAATTIFETQVGAEDHVFHTFPYLYNYADTTARALRDQLGTGKSVVILYSDTAFGKGGLADARKYYTENGFKILSEELIRHGSADFNPVLSKIRSLHADVLVSLTETADLVNLAKQIEVAHLGIPYLVAGNDVALGEWQRAVGSAQEGWIGITGYIAGMASPGDPQRADIFPPLAEWEKRFDAKFHVEPTGIDVYAYVSTALLLLAIEKVGDDPTKVTAELAAMDQPTTIGRAKFSKTDGGTVHQAFQDWFIIQRQAGRSVIIFPRDISTGDLVARKAS